MEKAVISRRNSSGQGNGGGGGAYSGPSEAQKILGGGVAEYKAFRWLQAKYEGVDETCWKSGYRDKMFGGAAGDDTLGYDFEVCTADRVLYFEVKSTTGSALEFQLGLTECAFAQKVRSNDYQIILLYDFRDGEPTKLTTLPNPFGQEGGGCYEVKGHGLRLAVRPSSAPDKYQTRITRNIQVDTVNGNRRLSSGRRVAAS